MKLITKKIAQKLPRIYSNDGKDPEDVPVRVKFFDPMGSWTWYATEADAFVNGKWVELTGENYEDAEEIKFFGYVDGQFGELGYFTLSQLEDAGKMLPIERDRHFGDKTLADVK